MVEQLASAPRPALAVAQAALLTFANDTPRQLASSRKLRELTRRFIALIDPTAAAQLATLNDATNTLAAD